MATDDRVSVLGEMVEYSNVEVRVAAMGEMVEYSNIEVRLAAMGIMVEYYTGSAPSSRVVGPAVQMMG
jgi:hypothetical protein